MKKKKQFKIIKQGKEFTPERALKLATGVAILGTTTSLIKNL